MVDIINNCFLSNSSANMPTQNAPILCNVLSNILAGISQQDCKCSTEFCQNLQKFTMETLQKVADSLMKDAVPGQPPQNLTTDLFSINIFRTSVCDLDQMTIGSGADQPTLKLKAKNLGALDCS